METNFLPIVINEFRSDLSTKELSLLSNRLLIVAAAAEHQNLNYETKQVVVHELRIMRSEYIKSEYKHKWEVLRLISQMETHLCK